MHATTRLTPRPPGCVRLLAGLTAWLFLTLGLAAQSADTGTINGRVTDAVSNSVLPGAEITVSGSDTRTATGKDGEFSLKLPAGTYDVTVNYLGQPPKTVSTTVTAGSATTLPVVLGDDVVQLEAFTVEGSREGQARAVNQQRVSQNLTSIISSDLSGQFPDKNIADAVKRLPGVTVETDTDTGGSEGRYISIRGLNSDFNAVSVNGMRVSVSDFNGLSRRVPLDVVSSKSADQIEVTKALRPDQDGDGIGGAVNIVTRSPFDRDGVYASVEGAVGFSSLSKDYTSNYPYTDPETEFSGSFSTPLGKEGKHGIALSANYRDYSLLKQRIGTTGWSFDGVGYSPSGGGGAGVALQHFFDDITSTGGNLTYEWRPNDDNTFRVDFSYSSRDTERGRQRLFYRYFDGETATETTGDDTYDTYTSTSTRVDRNVRQFFETQEIINLTARGETRAGNVKFDYFSGLNRGTFDGDPNKDINARFESNPNGTTTYIANGYSPQVGFSGNENSPANFRLRSIDRGTSYVTDDEIAGGLDATLDSELAGGDGFWKFGVKGRLFDRDYEKVENFFFNTNAWNLNSGPAGVGSSVADYGANSTVGGNPFGFFIDPDKLRQNAAILDANGSLNPATDNADRSLANSYQASEDIYSTYALGQFTWGQLTALTGARAEFTRVNFTGNDGTIDGSGNVIAVTPYDRTRDYVNVLPGLHLRYDQTKNLVYRFAVTRSIARARISDLNPTETIDNDNREVVRGNLDLDPTTSTNVDLGFEYYFSNASVLSFGLFYKDMESNAYTTRSLIAGGPQNGYTLITPANAESAWVRGFEFGYDQQFTFLPAPFDGLGAFANYTYADSEVDTGIAAFANEDLPLFNQVGNTVNVGLFYEKSGFRARVSVLHRTESLIDIQTDAVSGNYDPKLSRYLAPNTTLDITGSYRFAKNWTVFASMQNALSEPGRAYDGNKNRMDYNEVTKWSANLGLRWSL